VRDKWWSVLFGVTMLAAFLGSLAAPLFGWWLPRNVSPFGGSIDGLFYLILAITGIFFVLTEALLVYNMYKFAAEPGRKSEYVHGNHKLEMLWTVVPGAILLFLALWQIATWAEIKYPRSIAAKANHEALQMEVQARQWEWRVRYPSPERLASWLSDKSTADEDYRLRLPEHADDIWRVNEIHTWKGASTIVHLRTQDVLHSFFLPQIRLKQDALPGKTIPVWFAALEHNTAPVKGRESFGLPTEWAEIGFDPKTGKGDVSMSWELACAEFCGARHSLMRGKLYVHETRADFVAWLTRAQYENSLPIRPEPSARAAAAP
jgi:cytochrome c oxidase subunit 2